MTQPPSEPWFVQSAAQEVAAARLGSPAGVQAESDRDQLEQDRRRTRRLGRARVELIALPALVEELARCVTEQMPGNDESKKGKPGSRPPLRLDVLHLTDERRKPGWEGDDPRVNDLTKRYGIAPLLETWTRVMFEEIPEDLRPELSERATVRTESAALVEAWSWIAKQPWAHELADDVITVIGWVKVALAMRRDYVPRCRYCSHAVRPVDADRHETAWEVCAYGLCSGCGHTFAPGPELAALGQVQDPIPLTEAAELTGIPLRTLQRWVTDGLVQPAPNEKGKRRGRKFDLSEIRAVATRVHGRIAG